MIREHATLVGTNRGLATVITDPPHTNGGSRVAAICLNAGVIHRVGPSRLYVYLSRALAEAGWTAARFDHSGIGDSPVRKDGLPFEQSAVLETREVMNALAQSRKVERFVLIGLCSGAVTAFDTALQDERVAGILMINPWGFDQSTEWNEYVANRGRARKYWTRSLLSPASWMRALTGRIDYRRLFNVLWRQAASTVAPAPVVKSVATRASADLDRLIGRGVRVLLICSEGDEGIDYMNIILGREVRRIPSTAAFAAEVLPGADHSLTLLGSQRRVVEIAREWAAGFGAPGRPREAARAPRDLAVAAADQGR
jgi:pimeloyl-ACP methyl ester carboxylesterase